jgi:hypothetical protein
MKNDEALNNAVMGLTTEVRGLRGDMNRYAPRDEVERKFDSKERARAKRVTAIVALLFLLIGSVQFTGYYVQECGPGARSSRVLDSLLGGLDSREEFLEISRDRPQPVCDMIIPTSGDEEGWPSKWNLIGFGMYSILLVGGATLVYMVNRRAQTESPLSESEET